MKVRGRSIDGLFIAVQTNINSTNIMTSSELEYKQDTFGNWDKIGVRFFSKGWSVDIESKWIGLLIRWFRVRASGHPFSQMQSQTMLMSGLTDSSGLRSDISFRLTEIYNNC